MAAPPPQPFVDLAAQTRRLHPVLDARMAAVLLAKLTVFEDELGARGRAARRYDARLGDAVTRPARPEGVASAWAQYTIQVPNRDRVRDRLARADIPAMVYYPLPMHRQPAYAAPGDGPGSLPASEALAVRVLTLPMHPYLDEATIERIAAAVRAAIAA